jgi:hypothetical protein
VSPHNPHHRGVGWLVDAFLIPRMERDAARAYARGPKDYTIAWVLLTFTGVFGLHRFYLGRVWTGLLWFFTLGLFGVGLIYDFWTLNGKVDASNQR